MPECTCNGELMSIFQVNGKTFICRLSVERDIGVGSSRKRIRNKGDDDDNVCSELGGKVHGEETRTHCCYYID